jgi:hypothetical protein
MREKPYQIIDTEKNEVVEWVTYQDYILKYAGKPGYDVNYRPGRKKPAKKKEFPYNG